MSKKKDDDKKVIHFPDPKKRASTKSKETGKQKKSQEALEKKYRDEYRSSRAKAQSYMARNSASGKVPFINWDKIPVFARISIGILLLVQIIMSFAISSVTKAEIIFNFGFTPDIYTSGAPLEWSAFIAPFSSLIIHSGWMHLAFNMVMLLAMGVFFERQFGTKRTAIFFVLCGLAGNLAYLMINPASPAPVVGASGAISGLFAVTFIIMIERGILGPEIQKRGPTPFILIWSTIIIALGLISNDTSWQSHIGGFLGGVGLFHLLKKGLIRF